MGTFRKVTRLKTQVIGSIQSDTGSEYLFGFDPDDGLIWLERSGVEYNPADKAWREADGFIRASLGGVPVQADVPVMDEVMTEEPVVVGGRPGSVTRSIAAEYSMGVPQAMVDPHDPRVVVPPGSGGDMEVDDDELAANAALMYDSLED